MTVGDVNATAWIVGGTMVTLWAAIAGTSVLFHEKSKRAADALQNETPKVLGIGAGILLLVGVLTIVLLNQANGLLKFIGMIMGACLVVMAILGSAGLATLVGEHLRRLDSRLSTLDGILRGAALLVAAGLLPAVGWVVLFPAMFLFSLGAGWRALRTKAVPALAQAAKPTATTS